MQAQRLGSVASLRGNRERDPSAYKQKGRSVACRAAYSRSRGSVVRFVLIATYLMRRSQMSQRAKSDIAPGSSTQPRIRDFRGTGVTRLQRHERDQYCACWRQRRFRDCIAVEIDDPGARFPPTQRNPAVARSRCHLCPQSTGAGPRRHMPASAYWQLARGPVNWESHRGR